VATHPMSSNLRRSSSVSLTRLRFITPDTPDILSWEWTALYSSSSLFGLDPTIRVPTASDGLAEASSSRLLASRGLCASRIDMRRRGLRRRAKLACVLSADPVVR